MTLEYQSINLDESVPNIWRGTIPNGQFKKVYRFSASNSEANIQYFLKKRSAPLTTELWLEIWGDSNNNGVLEEGVDKNLHFLFSPPNSSYPSKAWELVTPSYIGPPRVYEKYFAVVETVGPESVDYEISLVKESSRDASLNTLDDVLISKSKDASTVVQVGGFKSVVIEYLAKDLGDLFGAFKASVPGSFSIEVYDDSNTNSILDSEDIKLFQTSFSSRLTSGLKDAGGRGFLNIKNNTNAQSNISIDVSYNPSLANLPAREGVLPFVLDRLYPLGQQDPTSNPIRDYDGNPHGFNGRYPAGTERSYRYQGQADVNGDGKPEDIFTNKISSRWATVSVDPVTGQIDYSRHGQGGSTRIVGIYSDPLVAEGEANKGFLLNGEVAPKRFGPFDSQQRFQNDLKIDNLQLRAAADYNRDGLMETYWKVLDGTAYLHAYMHADGNIQYSNYQSLQQMTDFLGPLGYANIIPLITA